MTGDRTVTSDVCEQTTRGTIKGTIPSPKTAYTSLAYTPTGELTL